MSGGEAVTMSRSDLTLLAGEIAQVLKHQQGLPELYAFPEDIVKITKGKVPENTIRYWRQMRWLRVVKLGRHCFVTPEDWQYFVENFRYRPASRGRA